MVKYFRMEITLRELKLKFKPYRKPIPTPKLGLNNACRIESSIKRGFSAPQLAVKIKYFQWRYNHQRLSPEMKF